MWAALPSMPNNCSRLEARSAASPICFSRSSDPAFGSIWLRCNMVRWFRIFPATRRRAKREREPLLFRQPELRSPREYVFGVEPGRDAVKPSSLREIADRDFEFAERLDGLRRNLNVAHQVDLANLADPHLFLQCILLADLQDFVRFPHPHALSIDIERAQVISRRYHLPHRARRRLLGHAILACREKIDLNSNRRAQAERVG